MDDKCNPLLVICNAKSVRTIVIHTKWLVRKLTPLVDRIHVGKKQNTTLSTPTKPCDDALADLWRRVNHHVRCVVRNEFDISTEFPETIRKERRQLS